MPTEPFGTLFHRGTYNQQQQRRRWRRQYTHPSYCERVPNRECTSAKIKWLVFANMYVHTFVTSLILCLFDFFFSDILSLLLFFCLTTIETRIYVKVVGFGGNSIRWNQLKTLENKSQFKWLGCEFKWSFYCLTSGILFIVVTTATDITIKAFFVYFFSSISFFFFIWCIESRSIAWNINTFGYTIYVIKKMKNTSLFIPYSKSQTMS